MKIEKYEANHINCERIGYFIHLLSKYEDYRIYIDKGIEPMDAEVKILISDEEKTLNILER